MPEWAGSLKQECSILQPKYPDAALGLKAQVSILQRWFPVARIVGVFKKYVAAIIAELAEISAPSTV